MNSGIIKNIISGIYLRKKNNMVGEEFKMKYVLEMINIFKIFFGV